MKIAAAVSATLLLAAGAARADDLSDLRERLEAQEQKIRVLERKLELQDEADEGCGPDHACRARLAATGLPHPVRRRRQRRCACAACCISTAATFSDDITPETADTWIFRRVRPTLEGTLNGIFDFRFTPDFAGGRTFILDAFVAARLKPWAVVTAGKFKVPVGLERLVSATDLRFIERGFPTSLVPNRDLGVQLGGDIAGGLVNYSVGYFNGVSDGGSSDATRRRRTPRTTRRATGPRACSSSRSSTPTTSRCADLGFGVAGTYVDSTGNTTTTLLPSYRTPGQQTFFSYRSRPRHRHDASDQRHVRGRRAAALDAAGVLLRRQLRRARRIRERFAGRHARDADSRRALGDARQHRVARAARVVRDRRGRGSSAASRPARCSRWTNGTWGALEFVARYHELDVDDDAFAGGANSFANPRQRRQQGERLGRRRQLVSQPELQVVAELRRDRASRAAPRPARTGRTRKRCSRASPLQF